MTFLKEKIANPYVLITLFSALPILELKGGILLSAALKISPFIALPLCYLGSCVAIPIVLLSLRPLIGLLKKRGLKLGGSMEKKLIEKAEGLSKRKNLCFALFCFVGIPVPLTGVWTGAALAAISDMPLSQAFPALFGGNLVSALIIMLIAQFFYDAADVIFGWFLVIALASTVLALVISAIKKRRIQPNTSLRKVNKSKAVRKY